jgi:hypothetical protein
MAPLTNTFIWAAGAAEAVNASGSETAKAATNDRDINLSE